MKTFVNRMQLIYTKGYSLETWGGLTELGQEIDMQPQA